MAHARRRREDGAFYLVHYTAWTVRAPATQVTWLVPRIL